MQRSPTITFRGVRRAAALETEILTRLEKLETYYPRMVGCGVLIEHAQRHLAGGNRYHVRIDLSVPGERIIVSHTGDLHATAQDVHARKGTKAGETAAEQKHARVAIKEAFDIARRQLQDYARRQRGAVKTTARQARGSVSRLYPVDEFGYITTEDGREVFFQMRSVLGNAFERMEVGSAVSYVEEDGEKGPQASTVKLLHRRRAHRSPAAAAVVPAAQ